MVRRHHTVHSSPVEGVERAVHAGADDAAAAQHSRLSGRVALVAGGDAALGRAVSVALATAGADVVLAPPESGMREAVATLQAVERLGRRGLIVAGDLDDPLFCRHVVSETVRALGGLDMVVDVASRGSLPTLDQGAEPVLARPTHGIVVVDAPTAADPASLEQLVRPDGQHDAAPPDPLTRLLGSAQARAKEVVLATRAHLGQRKDTGAPHVEPSGPTYVLVPGGSADETAEDVLSLLHAAGATPRAS